MKKIFVILFALLTFGAVHAQQRPLLTDDVDTVPTGAVRISAGVDFLQDAKFPLSGINGDLTRVGVVNVAIGLNSNVSFEVEGTIQNFVAIDNIRTPTPIPLEILPTANSTNDTGDFTLSTKIKLRSETKYLPAVGFKFGVTLPNSNQARGIGTNQVNGFGKILVGKKFGRSFADKQRQVNVFGNLGIGILTAPIERFTQNDVFLYGLGGIVRVNKRFNIVSEVNGRVNTRSGRAPLGTESVGEFRFGTQVRASGLRFDAAGTLGLTRYSPRSGLIFGVTYETPSIFTPAK